MSSSDDIEKQRWKGARKSRWGDISDSDSDDSDDDSNISRVDSSKVASPIANSVSPVKQTAKTAARAREATLLKAESFKEKKSHLVVVPKARRKSTGKFSTVDIAPVHKVPLCKPITTLFFLNMVDITTIDGVPLLLCASSSCDISAVDIQNGETVMKFEGHVDRVLSFAVSPPPPKHVDPPPAALPNPYSPRNTRSSNVPQPQQPKYTQYVTAGACDDYIAIWEMVGGAPKQLHGIKAHNGSVWSVQIYIDPMSLAAFVFSAGNEGLIKVWHVRTGKRVNSFKGHIGRVLTLYILQKDTVCAPAVNDVNTKYEQNISGKFHSASKGIRLNSLTSNSNNMLFSGGQDKVLRVWDMFNGNQRKQFTGHTSDIHCVKAFYASQYKAASQDIIILSSGLDSTVRVWSYESGSPLHVLQGHVGCVYGVDYLVHTDGVESGGDGCAYPAMTVYSGSADGTVRTWELTDGHVSKITFKKAHTEGVRSIAVKKGVFEDTAPEQVIVATCSWDKVLQVQDVEAFKKNIINEDRCLIS